MFDKVLSMPTVLNIPRFWIVSGSKCARVLDTPGFWIWNMSLVFNMSGFWLYQSSEYARVTQGSEHAWIIPEYAWLCLVMPEYAWICLNLPEWPLFYIFSFPHFFCNPFFTWTRGNLFEGLQETRGYSLTEHAAVFMKKQNLIFSIAARSISFVFCFRLNNFASNI